MSLQRIFESARKLGVPVIMTDSQGREPLIVLPLEQFEAMVGEEGRMEVGGGSARKSMAFGSESIEPRVSIIKEERQLEDSSNIEEVPQKVQLEMISNREVDNSEISLEERFYLEPIEDKDAI